MATLRFYFDFISPYAYLGWVQLHEFAARRRLKVEPVPVLFAAMLGHWGHKGPAEIAPKRVYTFKHVVRLAQGLGVPLQPPIAHPFNPLLALRIASVPMPEQEQRRVTDMLFARTWVGRKSIWDADALVKALCDVDLDGEKLVQEACSPEGKARVRAQTDAAIEQGVFGVPSFVVPSAAGDEVFWGQDVLGHLEAFLEGEDPAAGVAKRWGDIPAAAQRTV